MATWAVIASSQKCISEDFCGCIISLPDMNHQQGDWISIAGILHSTMK